MSVRDPSSQVDAMAEDWTLIDALMGGTKAMRRAGKKYLPKWQNEVEASYQTRLGMATLFPAYQRTVSVLTGKPFSKPITIGEDVPPRVVEWLENVDLQNRNLDTFAAEVANEAMAYGICGILVDCPPCNGARTVSDEKAAGIRPYLIHVKPGNILGWRATSINGNRVLTQLRLLETIEEEDGEFAVKIVEQVRVLERGSWAVYRKKSATVDEWVEFDRGVTSLQEIPFVPVYGFRVDFMVGKPPMLELAHLNVEHWQSSSDQQTILHVARVPILFGKGLTETSFTVSASSLVTGGPDGDLKYVEPSGASIESGRKSILDLEDRMRQTGAELLVIKPGNTTEVQTVADNEMGMCDLQRIMQAVEGSLDQALDLMAKWVGEAKGGHVTIYRDFGAATLAEASAELLFKMTAGGKLSFETLLNELKRRGVLGPDLDIEEEIKRAKAEAPPLEVQEQVRA